jgi:hypothetical protein
MNGAPMIAINHRPAAGFGYSHPSPSIPLPVEGRGKQINALIASLVISKINFGKECREALQGRSHVRA